MTVTPFDINTCVESLRVPKSPPKPNTSIDSFTKMPAIFKNKENIVGMDSFDLYSSFQKILQDENLSKQLKDVLVLAYLKYGHDIKSEKKVIKDRIEQNVKSYEICLDVYHSNLEKYQEEKDKYIDFKLNILHTVLDEVSLDNETFTNVQMAVYGILHRRIYVKNSSKIEPKKMKKYIEAVDVEYVKNKSRLFGLHVLTEFFNSVNCVLMHNKQEVYRFEDYE